MPRWQKQLDQLLAGQRRTLLIPGACVEIMQKMPAGIIDGCAVDPPYGVDWRGKENKHAKGIANDKHPYVWFLHELFRVLKPSAALACFHVERLQQEWKTAIELAGFRCHNQFIWDKGHGGMGDCSRQFAPCDERAWIASKGRWRLPHGRPDNLLRCGNIPPGKRNHPTEKPVEVMAYLVKHLVRRKNADGLPGLVIDPTMGSGSTGVAAVREGYRFIGIELDPENFAVARSRVNAGLAATLHCPKARVVRREKPYLADRRLSTSGHTYFRETLSSREKINCM